MEPTTFFEHYRIGTGEAGREVSRTGAAINYKAIEPRSHEPVRLQLIPLATIEPEKLAQLKERAETAEKLDHVNIARTFAVGVETITSPSSRNTSKAKRPIPGLSPMDPCRRTRLCGSDCKWCAQLAPRRFSI